MNATKMLGFLLGGMILSAAAQEQPFHENHASKREALYYESVWGIDSLHVKTAGSGELVRFSWRVLDAKKSQPLNDEKAQPSLIDPAARVSLAVPSMEQIGPLRQSGKPEAGKSYWMAFSNKGMHVKRGDRVEVTIGNFRADNLVVE